MIFVIGGAYQGKDQWVKEHFPGSNIILDYQLRVSEQLKRDLSPIDEAARLVDICKKEGCFDRLVVVSNELGCGLVPMDKTDRIYREENGRVNCYFANQADEVYRVISGIATRIKG